MKVSPMEKELKHHDFISSTSFYIRSSLREARRRKLYFCLAVSSTFIVVAATAVTQTIMNFAPLIFLNSAESDAGANDVSMDYLSAGFKEDDGVTNTTVYKNLLFNTTAIKGYVDPIYPGVTVARYMFPIVNLAKQSGYCSTASPCYNVEFHLQDTLLEADLGMKTKPELTSEIPYGGVVMTAKYARSVSAGVGSLVYMYASLTEILRDVAVQYNSKQTVSSNKISQNTFSNLKAWLPFKVVAIVDDMGGKYKDGTTDVVIAEYKYFFDYLSRNMPSASYSGNANYQKFIQYLRTETSSNYASQMIFNMPDRRDIYRDSNFDNIQEKVTLFASRISDALGVFPYQIETPVLEKLNGTKFGGLFLGIVMVLIIAILFILSTILIYNLLLVTVETKCFEFGVIRMVGLTKQGIAHLILAQSLMFALPGVVLGLILSVPLLIGLGGVLEGLINATIPKAPAGMALFWSILIGLAIPIISSYYPMRQALSKNLNLSLDLVHSKTVAVQVSIEIGSKRFPYAEVTFGILSVLFGVAIYIILPLSLLSMQLGLLLGMFFVILIGLLIGLTLLALNFQHLMARLVTAISFFWTNTSFRSLILKNLLAHKLRNRQTTLMYSLALGFIIFILVTLNQELKSMSYQAQADHGALIELKSKSYLNVNQVETLMSGTLADVVESYAFISHDLESFLTSSGKYQSIVLTHLGQLYSVTPIIRAVSPWIYTTTINEFLVANFQDENTGLSLGEQLYTARGGQGVIIGQAYRDQLGITRDLESSVILRLEDGVNTKTEELRVIAALESSPTFTFSPIPSVTSQDILISLPTAARICGNLTMNVRNIPIEKVLVKVKGDSDENLEKVYVEFEKMKETDGYLEIWDYRDTRSEIESNQNILSFIFKAVEIVVMLLSMFSLVTSMSTNIMEQTKEIAVMRAIGMSRLKVNMLYVSEAFVLIFSSAIFGIIVGTLVAWTLSIQRVLFTQLPLIFTFPGMDLVLIIVVAAISAFLSSYFPAKRVTKYQISKIIRLGA